MKGRVYKENDEYFWFKTLIWVKDVVRGWKMGICITCLRVTLTII